MRGLGFHRLREKHDVSSVEAKNEQREELRNSSSTAVAAESAAAAASDAGHSGEDANKKASVFHLSFFGKGGQERHCTDGFTTQDEAEGNEAKGTMKTTTTEDSLKTGEQELETVLDCEESTSAEDANKKASVFHLSFFGKGGQERHCTDGSTAQDEAKDNEAKGTMKTTTEDSLKTGEQELGTVLDCEKSTSAAPGLFPFWNKKAH